MTAPATTTHIPLVDPARAAMIRIYRHRARMVASSREVKTESAQGALFVPVVLRDEYASVSAIDLAQYLDRIGWDGDRKWSGVVFTSPPGLWRRIGYDKNPRRHNAPTPLFALDEDRAAELGL